MTCEVIEGLERLAGATAGAVVTIGNFDGVHLGHQHILHAGRRLADRAGVRLCAVTFDPPPAALLAAEGAAERIMPEAVKHRYLGECGADMVVVVETTIEFLSMEPEQFLREVIAQQINPSWVVEGHNFFFGRKRAGNVNLLRQMAGELGFDVEVVTPAEVQLPGRGPVRVSSSLIRELIRAGEVAQAATCLSRPFTLFGRVIGGERRGRALEYPTANVDPDAMICPGDGVYAGRAQVGGLDSPAAVSIGTKPTFGVSARVIEANLMGAEGDFYGQPIAVTFLERLRDQWQFPDAESLKAQIAKDVQRVKEICR